MKLPQIPGRNASITVLPKTLHTIRTTHRDPNHMRLAYVDHVVDGDSVWFWIDLDFDGIHAHRNCRFIGIDALDKQPAKEISTTWLENRLKPLQTVHLYIPAIEKYGRPLVGVYVDEYGPSLNEQSLAAGMSVPYFGGPR